MSQDIKIMQKLFVILFILLVNCASIVPPYTVRYISEQKEKDFFVKQLMVQKIKFKVLNHDNIYEIRYKEKNNVY
jgi:preprotein translocase subunit SecB